MLILGGLGCSKEQQWYHLSDVSGGATIDLTVSFAFAYKKSKTQIESVVAQTESVAYMTNLSVAILRRNFSYTNTIRCI